MKFITKYLLGAVFLTAPFVCFGGGDAIDPNKVATVTYDATAYAYVDYEIASSTAVVSVNCANTREDAAKRIQALKDGIQNILVSEGSASVVSPEIKFEDAKFSLVDPVSDSYLDPATNKYSFLDKCTNAHLKTHENRAPVWEANVNVSFSLPVSEANLVDSLASAIEEYGKNDKDKFSSVECANGERVQKSVSDATKSAIISKLESDAKVNAEAKMNSDKTSYAAKWVDRENTGFVLNNSVPSLLVPKNVRRNDKGIWVADVSLNRNFNVGYLAKSATGDKLLQGQRTYTVNTKDQANKGLYGVLTIAGTQGCFTTEEEALAALNAESIKWLAEAEKIVGILKTETDRTEAGRVKTKLNDFVSDEAAIITNDDGDNDYRYYSQCEPERLLENYPNQATRWSATFSHKIYSSNLDELERVKKDIAQSNTFKRVNELSVSANLGAYQIAINEQCALNDKLCYLAQVEFMNKEKGEVWKDAGTYCYDSACIRSVNSYPTLIEEYSEDSESIPGDRVRYMKGNNAPQIKPAEEGLMLLSGTYKFSFFVYWPLDLGR